MYVVLIYVYLLCMIKDRVRWCTLTFGKLIGLLLFCLPLLLLSVLFRMPLHESDEVAF